MERITECRLSNLPNNYFAHTQLPDLSNMILHDILCWSGDEKNCVLTIHFIKKTNDKFRQTLEYCQNVTVLQKNVIKLSDCEIRFFQFGKDAFKLTNYSNPN